MYISLLAHEDECGTNALHPITSEAAQKQTKSRGRLHKRPMTAITCSRGTLQQKSEPAKVSKIKTWRQTNPSKISGWNGKAWSRGPRASPLPLEPRPQAPGPSPPQPGPPPRAAPGPRLCAGTLCQASRMLGAPYPCRMLPKAHRKKTQRREQIALRRASAAGASTGAGPGEASSTAGAGEAGEAVDAAELGSGASAWDAGPFLTSISSWTATCAPQGGKMTPSPPPITKTQSAHAASAAWQLPIAEAEPRLKHVAAWACNP